MAFVGGYLGGHLSLVRLQPADPVGQLPALAQPRVELAVGPPEEDALPGGARKIGTTDEAFGEPEERDVTGDIGGVRGEGAGRPSQGSAEGDGMRRPTRA